MGHAHLSRYAEIAGALARHGLGFLVSKLGLERFVPYHRGLLGHPPREEPYSRPDHLRMALEDLGTTFVKLGQILSTRADLLPPEYVAELARLLDEAPQIDAAAARDALEAEIGRPVEEAFASFDPTPLAAASIGQAHAAVLRGGGDVVVKVRRPGVVEQVETDLEILRNLAVAASRRWEIAESYDLVAVAEELATALRGELDYIREGRNADRFRASFIADPKVHVPLVHWDLTTSRVITLERIRGLKLSELGASPDVDRPELARRAARISLKMIFEDGFFHGDPHPGNFFIEPGGRFGLIDFGLVGTLDARQRAALAAGLLAAAARDSDRLVDVLLDLGIIRHRIDRAVLRRDLDDLVARFSARPIGELALGPALQDLLAVVRRHRLQLPSDLALLAKTLATAESVGVSIDPTFRIADVMTPYARELVLRELSPTALTARIGGSAFDLARAASELPRQLHRFFSSLERGAVEIGVRPEGAEPLVRRLERAANRLALAILLGAALAALAVLLVGHGASGARRWFGAAFAAVLVLAAVLTVWIGRSLFRSR